MGRAGPPRPPVSTQAFYANLILTRNLPAPATFPPPSKTLEANKMRGGLLWLLGVPIPVIILLYLFHVI